MEFIKEIQPEIVVGVIIFISLILGIIVQKILKKSDNTEKEKGPNKDYGEMDTQRAKDEFDMDDDEIKLFLEELNGQINEELPLIEEYMKNKDYVNLKNSIHKIKGSAVNLGEGGIAKLLFDFNHFLSEGKKDKKQIKNMYEDIIYYKEKLI